MACLYIQSDNPTFSYAINKNPNSGIKGKNIRKGVSLGYFSSTNQYNIVFFEGADSISFPNFVNQQFSYIDSSQYNSPNFILASISNYFSSALNKPNEFDIPSNCIFYVNSVCIKRNVIYKLLDFFPQFTFELTPLTYQYGELDKSNFSLKITGNQVTLYELLNLVYLLSFFCIIWDNIQINVDSFLTQRLIRAIKIIDAPYYIRYLLKLYAIQPKDFKKFKEELEASDKYKIKLCGESNANRRINIISSLLTYQNDIIDFGAGEGAFLSLANHLHNYTYYAIDKNPNMIDKLNKKIITKNLDNVIVLESINDFIAENKYDVIMSEVFEHNKLSYMTELINRFINDSLCQKIIITTPNKEFNQFYLLNDNELRHEDHQFEMTFNELNDYFKQFNVKYQIKNLGDEVNDIPTIGLIILDKAI